MSTVEKKILNVKINGKEATVPEGTVVLEVCKKNDVEGSNLCYNRKLKPFAACRTCMVETVVDGKKELLGRITIDDIVDVIKEEADKDYQLAAGISADVEADDKVFDLVKARLPWLFLGLLGGLGSVFILQDYETIMEQPSLRNLFFYTPLIAAMAGNVGVQSSAIIVQGIANDVVKGSLFNRLLKEIGLSLINGFSLALVIIIFGQFINQSFLVSATIAGSMMLVIVVAALVGTFVPIVLDKQGIDPAIATGPFITTANDIFGIFLFFYVAKLILGF